jgi:AraC-like DNA-binding protein
MDAEGGVARYIQSQRLLDAYTLLSDPDAERSITAIADELCFADVSGFSRAFRRQFGAKPSDVRADSRSTATPDEPSAHASGPTGKGMYSLLRAA